MLIKKYELVEFTFGVNFQPLTISFNDIAILRGVQILGLEIFPSEVVTKSPKQNDVLTAAQLGLMSFQFYTTDVDTQKVDDKTGTVTSVDRSLLLRNVPAMRLNTMEAVDGSGNAIPFSRYPFITGGQTILWSESIINLGAILGNSGGPVSLLIGVIYQGLGQT